MTKKKPGRPVVDDKRKPFNMRLKESILEALKSRAANENRKMNSIVEMILERELL